MTATIVSLGIDDVVSEADICNDGVASFKEEVLFVASKAVVVSTDANGKTGIAPDFVGRFVVAAFTHT